MNKSRRKEIGEAVKLITKARGLVEEANAAAAEAISMLETARDDEQEYKDNMPENMQDGDKGQMADSAIDNLENAVSSAETFNEGLETAISDLQEVIDKLESDDSEAEDAESSADAATE